MRQSKKSRKPVRPRVTKSGPQPAYDGPDFSKVPPVPYIWGYARVSTAEQSLDMQITALKAAGCEDRRLLFDKLSGKTAQRLEFKRLLKALQPHDTLIIYSFSRIFRNTKLLLELFDDFKAKKIKLISLTERGIDVNTSHGRMVATMLAAVDQNEVDRVRDRTVDGMAEKARQGVKFGAPPKVSEDDAKVMARMRFKTGIPVPAIATKYKVSDAAVYHRTKPYAANYL